VPTSVKSAVIPIEFIWVEGGQDVKLAGDFLGKWTQTMPMEQKSGVFRKTLKLRRGKYFYKFIVDGIWRCNPDFPQAVDSEGNLNNVIDISDPDRALRLVGLAGHTYSREMTRRKRG
jgi:5'-AMP-activated protein kinase regulatory beta subunit